MTRRTSFIKRVWNFLGLHQLSPSLHRWGFSLVTRPGPWPLIGWWGPGDPAVIGRCHEVIPGGGCGVTPLMPQAQVTGGGGRHQAGKWEKWRSDIHYMATVNDFLWILSDQHHDEMWNSKTWMYDPINSPDLSGGCQEDQTSPQYIIVWRICQAWLKTL